MFEGTRLSYLVPGYTGFFFHEFFLNYEKINRHIPKRVMDDEPVKRNEGEYQLPGKYKSICFYK